MEQKLKKYDRKNQGITLIALVITIIVMLILVAVTISMAVNGGLFDYAGKAVGETQNALDVEQQLANGAIQVDGVWYDSIDDYLSGKPAVTTIHSWTRSGDTFRCSHCEAEYIMGAVVNYQRENAGETTTTTLTAEKSGLDKLYEAEGSYPGEAIVDGYGNQTIEAQDVNWVVLGIEDANGDGVNETLLITTEIDLWIDRDNWTGLFFYGAAKYNNGVDEINRICKELYSNNEYGFARGMTIEDVNAALNYTPYGGYYYEEDGNYQTTGNLTTKLKDLPIFSSIILGGTYTPDGTNTEETLGEYELNGYGYGTDGLNLVNDIDSTPSPITEIEKSIIFGPYIEEWERCEYCYWLASRGVDACYGCAHFGLGCVNGGAALSCGDTFYSNGSEYVNVAGFRPVVSLTSKLPEANVSPK